MDNRFPEIKPEKNGSPPPDDLINHKEIRTCCPVRKDMANKLLVAIGGPTGTGKTDLAIRLAQHYGTEIISADSRQVYKELRIGVGRPTEQQLSLVPHHMIGIVSIQDDYSVADFTAQALDVIEKGFRHHDILFLTGGTGLYIKAITAGFDHIPEVDKEITEQWTSIWKIQGIDALVSHLKQTDPDYYDVVDRSNPRRLIRALAVTEATGKPYSSFLVGEKISRPFDTLHIALELPREDLYARINQRVLDMMHQGWEAEARSLLPYRHLKALDTVGYKELFEYFNGLYSLPETISAIQQSTRRYAKRQMTWFRHQGEWTTFSPHDAMAVIGLIDQTMDNLNLKNE
jgi:tRNA dimethylallyltransferase